jgi:hypothetical protein
MQRSLSGRARVAAQHVAGPWGHEMPARMWHATLSYKLTNSAHSCANMGAKSTIHSRPIPSTETQGPAVKTGVTLVTPSG